MDSRPPPLRKPRKRGKEALPTRWEGTKESVGSAGFREDQLLPRRTQCC